VRVGGGRLRLTRRHEPRQHLADRQDVRPSGQHPALLERSTCRVDRSGEQLATSDDQRDATHGQRQPLAALSDGVLSGQSGVLQVTGVTDHPDAGGQHDDDEDDAQAVTHG
jgi:hypothetical protein